MGKWLDKINRDEMIKSLKIGDKVKFQQTRINKIVQ
jgi:hypothetical protein